MAQSPNSSTAHPLLFLDSSFSPALMHLMPLSSAKVRNISSVSVDAVSCITQLYELLFGQACK